MLSSTAIKKLVIRGRQTKYGPADLYVNEAGGQMWATNTYWAVPAFRVAPLLAEYNLSASEPGAYAVNGKVSPSGKQVPSVAALMGDVIKTHTMPGTRVQLGKHDAFVLDAYGGLMAVYQLASGLTVGLVAGEIEWLSSLADVSLPEDCRFNGTRVMFRDYADDHGNAKASAAFIADVTRVIEPHKYGTDPETRGQTEIPEVSEPGEPVLLALVMAVRYDRP